MNQIYKDFHHLPEIQPIVNMVKFWFGPIQVIEKQALPRTWNKKVFPSDYFGYFHQVIIYNRSQFVGGKSIFSPNQKIWKINPRIKIITFNKFETIDLDVSDALNLMEAMI